MGLPPVVVEISASDASAELRSTLVDACSRAVQDGECVESEGATPEAAAVAIVSAQPDGTIRIEVGLRSDQPWHTRILRFESDEEPGEVFTAVGFAIGALVGRLQQEEDEEVIDVPADAPEPAPPALPLRPHSPPPPTPVVPPPPPREPRPEARGSAWTASAALLGGSGRAWSNWRVGATAALAWVHSSGVSLNASGTYAASPAPLGSVEVDWAGFGLGPGYELGVGPWASLALVGELGMEHHHAEITLAESGRRGEASRWVGMGKLGASLIVPTRSPVAATLGVGTTAPFGATEIRVAGLYQRTPAAARATALVGIRYDARYARR